MFTFQQYGLNKMSREGIYSEKPSKNAELAEQMAKREPLKLVHIGLAMFLLIAGNVVGFVVFCLEWFAF